MSEENKRLAKRWFEEVWNQQNASAIDEMFHPDGSVHGFPGTQSPIQGPEGFKELHRNFLQVFPDVHVHVEDVIAEGDRVAVRWTATMTHRGDGLGIPPTGNSGQLQGSSFFVARDGKILDGWNQMDFQALINQLQAEPSSPKPAAS